MHSPFLFRDGADSGKRDFGLPKIARRTDYPAFMKPRARSYIQPISFIGSKPVDAFPVAAAPVEVVGRVMADNAISGDVAQLLQAKIKTQVEHGVKSELPSVKEDIVTIGTSLRDDISGTAPVYNTTAPTTQIFVASVPQFDKRPMVLAAVALMVLVYWRTQ